MEQLELKELKQTGAGNWQQPEREAGSLSINKCQKCEISVGNLFFAVVRENSKIQLKGSIL